MKSAAAIVVDGVLRKHVGGTPIPAGIALYHALCSTFTVVLLRSEANDDEFEHFLNSEQLTTHANVIAWSDWPGSEPFARGWQVGTMRTLGYAVDLVVEPSPHLAADLYAKGFNVLHFMHAQYQRPNWRPDFEGGQRPWDELVAEEARVAKLRAEDSRVGSVE